MNSNFFVADLLRTIEAFLLGSLILVAPGFVLAWATRVFDFRHRTRPAQFALAVTLSIGICPLGSYLLGRFLPAAIWPCYGLLAVAFGFLALRRRKFQISTPAVPRKMPRVFLVAGVIVALTMLTLVDFQIGKRLYFPLVTFDYALRANVVSALARSGVPPHNPLFYPGHFVILRYHYFWYILCATIQQLGRNSITARQAMIAGTLWCGIGLASVITLYLRFFQPNNVRNLNRRSWLALALLGVTGLDIVPVLLVEVGTGKVLGSLEWWNEQVTAWANIVLWVPHHLAALVACLTGFLVLWNTRWESNHFRRSLVSALAGFMFAGAAGLSVYVTFVFAVFMALWIVVSLVRRDRQHALMMLLSGLVAVLAASPFLLELAGIGGSGQFAMAGGSGPQAQLPVIFQVRKFPLLMGMLGLQDPQQWQAALVNLIALPLNYAFELGFFLLAGIVYGNRLWRNRRSLEAADLCAATMLIASLAVSSFLKSNVIGANDLGWRGFMLAQFVLLLWGAELLAGGTRALKGLLPPVVLTLALGFCGSAYDVLKIRFLPVLSDATPAARTQEWMATDDHLGERTYALRQIYDELRQRTPRDAVFQHNPNVNPQDNFHGMYADRQIAAETLGCGVVFGGSASECASRIQAITALFDDSGFEPARLYTACRALSIDFLIMQPTDRAWKDHNAWVWKLTPFLANDYARVFDCRSNTKADLP